jgi:hypothetical protein
MKDNYIVNSDLPSPSQQLTGDFVTFSDTYSTNPPEILVKDFPGTAVQNITIKLHTSYIKKYIGYSKDRHTDRNFRGPIHGDALRDRDAFHK